MRSSRAATFLRKGSGLRRYNGAGSPPKAFKRSQSQGNFTAAVTPVVNGNKVKGKWDDIAIEIIGYISCLSLG